MFKIQFKRTLRHQCRVVCHRHSCESKRHPSQVGGVCGLKSSGPKIEPWGTPQLISKTLEVSKLTPDHFRTDQRGPKLSVCYENTVIRIKCRG